MGKIFPIPVLEKKVHVSTVTILFWFGHSLTILQVKFLSWSEMNYRLLHSKFLPAQGADGYTVAFL